MFSGSEIGILGYSGNLGYYRFKPGYPRSLIDEFGGVHVPLSVDAADVALNTLYLLQGTMMYSYGMSGSLPFSYEFHGAFDMSVNGAGNPFSALDGSPLPTPPTGITTMVFDEDAHRLLALCQRELYELTTIRGHWEYKGTVTTPCPDPWPSGFA